MWTEVLRSQVAAQGAEMVTHTESEHAEVVTGDQTHNLLAGRQ